MSLISASTPLLADVRQLIDSARQRVASTVNAELTQLYWQIGSRVNAELLKGQRAEYGKQLVAELARQLTTDFGEFPKRALRAVLDWLDEHKTDLLQDWQLAQLRKPLIPIAPLE